MYLWTLSINHRTAPVGFREKLALERDGIERMLHELRALPRVDEAAVIATCNRFEVMLVSQTRKPRTDDLLSLLGRFFEIDPAVLEGRYDSFHAVAVARHIYRVASGLDSQIVGETQVLGQIKDAYRWAVDAGTAGSVLSKLFHHAFRTAKKVRTNTEISAGAVSVASAGVELCERVLGSRRYRSVLCVGAGEMMRLVAERLETRTGAAIVVTNRTAERATELAQSVHGRTVPWDERATALHGADVVIACTGASEPVIARSDVIDAMRDRSGAAMVLIDLGVPRDIDPAVDALPRVYRFDLDHLEEVAEANRKMRSREASAAEKLVAREVAGFEKWLGAEQATPTIKALNTLFEQVRQEELERFASKHPEADLESVERLTRSIQNKLLSVPMVKMKRTDDEDEQKGLLNAVQSLFNLKGQGSL